MVASQVRFLAFPLASVPIIELYNMKGSMPKVVIFSCCNFPTDMCNNVSHMEKLDTIPAHWMMPSSLVSAFSKIITRYIYCFITGFVCSHISRHSKSLSTAIMHRAIERVFIFHLCSTWSSLRPWWHCNWICGTRTVGNWSRPMQERSDPHSTWQENRSINDQHYSTMSYSWLPAL